MLINEERMREVNMIIASSTSGISDEIVKYIGKLLLYAEQSRRIE